MEWKSSLNLVLMCSACQLDHVLVPCLCIDKQMVFDIFLGENAILS